MMTITIKRLCPELAETYISYLSHLDFSHEPHWSSCLCRFYHMNDAIEDWAKRTFEDNRTDALRAIASGEMNGFLAFVGETCIGWLNANDATSYKRLEEYMGPYLTKPKVGMTICYVIHPDYRRQGVATALLKAAIVEFEREDYDFILALPIKADTFSEKQYRGTVSMYEKAGFVTVETVEDMQIMRLNLKGE